MKKKIMLYAGIILAFVVLSYSFAPQVLGGKIVNQSDISGWSGMSRESTQWNAAHPDDNAMWTGSMFSGMPTISFITSTKGDWTQPVYDALLKPFKRPVSYFFISLLGAFLLMLSLGISPLIAAGGAIAVTFCAYNLQIIQVGHNTKMQAIAFMPWVLAALIFCYNAVIGKNARRTWISKMVFWGVMFGLFLSFQVKANHPQISYYLALMIILYGLVNLVWLLVDEERRKSVGKFFIASALLIVLGLCGVATNATKLIPTWDYTPHSMRGGSTAAADGTKETKGLELDYMTAWSYGWEELPNLLIPNFNGGSSAGAVNPDKSETIALLKKAGQGNLKEISKNLPLYWGPQPFTAGPMYMGAITIFLFVLGLMFCRGREKWWIVVCTILAVLLSLGNHFIAFTKLFYDLAPLYNKFRTVSMSLTVLQVTLPALGFLVLDKVVRDEEFASRFKSKGWIALAITGGFCCLCMLFPGIAGDFHGASDAGQADVLTEALAADRRSLLVSDALRSLLLVAATFLVILFGVRGGKTGNRGLAAIIVCALVFVDLFAVGKRYLSADDFITPKKFTSQFNLRPVDEMILEDKDPSYRVLDLTVNVFNDSHPSYWHKNIGGYSPAKLQLYQKYIEKHLASEINSVYGSLKGASTISEAENALPYLEGLASLNCRYIIVGEQNPPLRYRYARGNAWFVDTVGDIEMTYYSPNELRYRYSSDNGGKAVFSEVYYPDWVARVDGRKIPLELSDEVLRSAVLPAGEHELVMRFEPTSYTRGEAVSRASSITLLLLLLLSAGGMLFNRINNPNNQ